jgi:hypothetical protein
VRFFEEQIIVILKAAVSEFALPGLYHLLGHTDASSLPLGRGSPADDSPPGLPNADSNRDEDYRVSRPVADNATRLPARAELSDRSSAGTYEWRL